MTLQLRPKTPQQGLTLVELMIALALSSFLLLGVFQVFTSNQKIAMTNKAFSKVQENGRMGLELITREVRMADYWGCAPDTTKIKNHLDPSDSDYVAALMNFTGAKGVDGSNDVGVLTIKGITVKPGTDTLELRSSRSATGLKLVPPYMTIESATIHTTTGITTLPKGKILMISDCNEADVFTNTAENTETSGNIIHNTGHLPNTLIGAVDNLTKELSHTYQANAQIIVPHFQSFFVGENDTGTYSLYRLKDNDVSELVRNVTDLQFTYGEDSTDDGNVDIFRDASTVSDMNKVGSIQLSLATESQINLVNGSPFSRTYTATTSIRNRTR